MNRNHRPQRTSPLFTSYQAASAAGISYRQLDYWVRIGLVRPARGAHGSGSQRRFAHRDVLLLAAVAELMRLGAGTEAATRLWCYLDGKDVDAWPSSLIVTTDGLAPADAAVSGWHVDLRFSVQAANAALLGGELEGVG